MNFSLAQLADYLGASLQGDAKYEVNGIAPLNLANSNQLSFLYGTKYAAYLKSSKAGILLLNAQDAKNWQGNAIIVDDVYLAYAQVSKLFAPNVVEANIHQTAQIGDNCQIGANCVIGANVVIADNVQIGDNCQIGANCVIGANTKIGKNCLIYPNVSLYHDLQIGSNVIIHSGAVIGADGFGFAKDKQGVWHKIAQLGSVEISDDVEIGANTTIDRGALKNTKIGQGVKLDNQIMIAHNVEIGANTALAACCGISGSTKIGKNCMLAGGVGLVGHIEICDDVFITGMTMVTHSITEAGSYSSGTAMQTTKEWKKSAVHIRKLDSMAQKINELKRELNALQLQLKQS